jgi:hypothetical protein
MKEEELVRKATEDEEAENQKREHNAKQEMIIIRSIKAEQAKQSEEVEQAERAQQSDRSGDGLKVDVPGRLIETASASAISPPSVHKF